MSRDAHRIRHSELFYSATVADSKFATVSLDINPGNPNLFPWLSRTAINYEDYRFNSIAIHFKTRTSKFTSGVVAMAPDYDNNDLPPIDLAAAMSYKDSASTAVYSNLRISLTPKLMFATAPHKYTRNFSDPVPSNLADYDCGKLFLMNAIDTATEFTYGDYWVSYDISLRSPQVPRSPSTIIPVGAVSSFAATPLAHQPTDLGAGYVFGFPVFPVNETTPTISQIPDITFDSKSHSWIIPPGVYDFIYNLDLRFGTSGAQVLNNFVGVSQGYETSTDDGATWNVQTEDTQSSASGSCGGVTAISLNPTLLGVITNALAVPILFRPFIRAFLNTEAGAALPSPLWSTDSGEFLRFTNQVLRKLTP